MKEKVILVVSLIFGLAALLLTTHYLKGKEAEFNRRIAEVYRGARKVNVVVASDKIPGGTVLTKKDLAVADVFESAAGSHAVRRDDVQQVLGKKVMFPVERGDVISWAFIEGGIPTTGGLSSLITPGLRAISLSVGGASAVSGMIQPKDNVDVLGTFAFPSQDTPGQMETVTLSVLQDVTVLATGQTTSREQLLGGRGRSRSSGGYSTVTLEVTPRESELLVFAQQMKGSLTLTLRHPRDVTWKRDLPTVNFDHLQHQLPAINLERQQNVRHKKDL
ncbi:MAG: Flp pilus assembly protein CpaB [Verrucomicrobia bacterium]|jgi:pilus assembly protein CpaB|nr:Flp pilus assembly protein CpaB [Verrucomicrobiota bacterium]